MEFQYDASWNSFTTILTSKLAAKEAWNKLIDFHEQTTPKSYWTTLRQLDIESEQAEIVTWLQQIVTYSSIPETVVAIWIGLLKFEHKGKEVPTIYLAGADHYDKDNIDWAINTTYLPENRYMQSAVLQQIDNIARTDEENYEFFDWIFTLAYCAFTLDEIIRTKLNKELFLTNKDTIFVTVGHDSGDYIELSSI